MFTVAFGIAQHAIVYPNEPMSAVMIYRMIRLPYWQMYGELFLDDIEGLCLLLAHMLCAIVVSLCRKASLLV